MVELSRKVAQHDKVRGVTVSSKYSSSDLNNNLAGLTQLAGDTKIYSEPNKDLEQRDVSQETITTHNGTISNFKQSERNVPGVEPCREQAVLSLTTGAAFYYTIIPCAVCPQENAMLKTWQRDTDRLS